jgi:hypothetical protein
MEQHLRSTEFSIKREPELTVITALENYISPRNTGALQFNASHGCYNTYSFGHRLEELFNYFRSKHETEPLFEILHSYKHDR